MVISRSHRTGLTLVEVSVILIIIGIITGGIVLGRDVIRRSEVRSVLSDIEKLESAVYAFRQKYNYLPGDFPSAETYWGSDTAGCPIAPSSTTVLTSTCNGNGNNKIDAVGWVACAASPTAASYEQEAYRMWQHLADGGFMPGIFTGVNGGGGARHGLAGTNIPKSSKIKEVGYQVMNFDGIIPAGGVVDPTRWFNTRLYHVLFIGREDNSSNCFEPNQPFLSAQEAWDIDNKNDDAMPGTGKWRAPFTLVAQSACTNGTSATADTANYLTTGTNPRSCSIMRVLDW